MLGLDTLLVCCLTQINKLIICYDSWCTVSESQPVCILFTSFCSSSWIQSVCREVSIRLMERSAALRLQLYARVMTTDDYFDSNPRPYPDQNSIQTRIIWFVQLFEYFLSDAHISYKTNKVVINQIFKNSMFIPSQITQTESFTFF